MKAKTILLAMAAALFAVVGQAQVCDVVYTVDTTAFDAKGVEHNVAGPIVTPLYNVPMADVLDNSEKMLKVVSLMSKLQDKGGAYRVETGETRTCDGKVVKVLATSVEVRGLTLDAQNKIAREGLKQADLIVKRYEERAAKGAKVSWDHDKAPKTERDDVGKRK